MDKEHIISPEWLVATRADVKVDDGVLGGWGVSPAPLMRGASFTDFDSHEIAVPFGESESERAVRLHELLHARMSPSRVPVQLLNQIGLSRQAINIAEEMRVNLMGAYMEKKDPSVGRISQLADGSEVGLAKSIVETGDWRTAVNLYLTTMNTDIHKKVKRTFRKNSEWKEAFTEIDKQLKEQFYTLSDIAGFNGCRSRLSSTTPELYSWVDDKTRRVDNATIPSGFIYYTMPLAQRIDQWIATPPKKQPKHTKIAPMTTRLPEAIERNSDWETLRFGLTSLTETTSAFIGKRKRPAMTGKFPVRPDRLLTDPERRIFRETVRGNGGVVVFDCSGSMSVTHDDIHDCVKQYSGATVVAYTFRGEHKANAWVLAKNGRMISKADFEQLELNNGNGVDAPILRWAIKERRNPKDFILWVSDGAVTGKGDRMTRELLRECALLSARHNIIGVENSREAIELLANMKRTGSMPRNSYCHAITQALSKIGK